VLMVMSDTKRKEERKKKHRQRGAKSTRAGNDNNSNNNSKSVPRTRAPGRTPRARASAPCGPWPAPAAGPAAAWPRPRSASRGCRSCSGLCGGSIQSSKRGYICVSRNCKMHINTTASREPLLHIIASQKKQVKKITVDQSGTIRFGVIFAPSNPMERPGYERNITKRRKEKKKKKKKKKKRSRQTHGTYVRGI
jgi:hypothetical protein